MNYALIVVDMLNDFFKDNPMKKKKYVLTKKINNLVGIIREKNIPIIFIRQEFKKDISDAYLFMKKRKEINTIQGTVGAQILSGIKIEKRDVIIIKKRFSAFYKTDLDQILRRLGIDTVFVVGISTMWCVFLTATDALSNDFYTIIVEDLAACHKKEIHDKFVNLYKNFPLFPIFRFLTSHEAVDMINKGKNAYTTG